LHRQTLAPQPLKQRPRERCVMESIRFSEKNANKELLAVQNSHGAPPHRPSSCLANIRPNHPAANEPMIVATAFTAAGPCAPSSIRRLVS
jgi:hypothetical protein